MLLLRFVHLDNLYWLKLSIIIVNYNVKYFLEHCLHSVEKAVAGIEAETIVIDNHSTDGSIQYLQQKFPSVKFVCSKENVGFARACNKGLQLSSGAYVLFLNPDTIIAEDCFKKCFDFFETHTDCGALGVKMIDGSGNFLKESKRAFPSPLTSLFKLFGLGRLFPQSKVFNRYHLGHLDENKPHEIDVLAGAFMLIKRSVLNKTGGFDEDFFMYGEDVDLSYRIQKSGFKNYYFPGTTVIHFKGESTKRGSLNYVRLFYNAMSIFVRKHYGGTKAGFYNFFIQIAIWLRAALSALFKFIKWIGLPVVDAAIILFSFWLVKELWIEFVKKDIVYPQKLLLIAFPVFTAIYLAAAYYAGLYDRFYRTKKLLRSTFIATVALLCVYALLPEQYRFSRAIVFFGALLSLALIAALRMVLLKAKMIEKDRNNISKPYILIAGTENEYLQTKSFLKKFGLSKKVIGRVAESEDNDAVITFGQLHQTPASLNAKEIIFCAGTHSYQQIIEQVQNIKGRMNIRFHTVNSESIIGSDTSTSSGHILNEGLEFNLAQQSYRRSKRLVDIVSSIFFISTFFIHIIFIRNAFAFFRNCFSVLAGKKTWVGYAKPQAALPQLRPGVLASDGNVHKNQNLAFEAVSKMDYWYARNYEPLQDVKTIMKNYQQLGS